MNLIKITTLNYLIKLFTRKIHSFSIIYLAYISLMQAQNIVYNSNFEKTIRTDTLTGKNRASRDYWCEYLQPDGYRQLEGSVDFYINSDECIDDYLNPCAYSGKNLIGLLPGEERLSGKFTTPMVKDSIYRIEFFLRLGIDERFGLKEIGFSFSKTKPTSYSKVFFFESNPNIITIPIGTKLSKRKKWIRITALYKSKGGEEYFVIGDNKQKYVWIAGRLQGKRAVNKGYYLFDDISIYPNYRIDSGKNNQTFKMDSLFKVNNYHGIKLRSYIIENINFSNNSFELSKTMKMRLDTMAIILKNEMIQDSLIYIEIQGHTDNNGDSLINIELSINRANAVTIYFISLGIDSAKLFYRGFGMSRPLYKEDTEFGKMKNRRVEIVLYRRSMKE